MYFIVRIECMARWTTTKNLGAFLDMIAERSFALLKDRRILANVWSTSSIRGRFAGSSLVIELIKSSINSKP
jgi:hypothetical protein